MNRVSKILFIPLIILLVIIFVLFMNKLYSGIVVPLIFFLLIIIVLYIMNSRWSLEINFSKPEFRYDEEIVGLINFKAKKKIESNSFKVFLKKKEVVGRGKRRYYRVVYEDSKLLEEKRIYPKNFSNSYNFNFKIPENETFEKEKKVLFGFKKIKYVWHIVVEIDAKKEFGFGLQSIKRFNLVERKKENL